MFFWLLRLIREILSDESECAGFICWECLWVLAAVALKALNMPLQIVLSAKLDHLLLTAVQYNAFERDESL